MRRSVDPINDHLLVQSRALGDPTRNAIFVYVRDARRPVGVAELTDHFGLNHNAIRQHLAKLRNASLLIESHEPPAGPGRPPLRYEPAAGAAERWGGSGPHEALSMLLLALIRGDGTPREVGRDYGRRLADEHRPGAATIEVLDAVARRLGFEPRVEATNAGVDVVLERCPFSGPAGVAPEIVCDIHHGIAEGIAERSAGVATITDLVVRPPMRAGCRIKVGVPA